MFIYPWGDMHSLNLGWFLLQFKEWVEKIQEYLDNGGGTSENLANVIAPVFNAENSYLTGDYVLYNDELYKASEPVPPGTWNPDAWERCLVTEEMGSSASGVDNVARLMIAGQYSNTYNYQKYAICRYADKLWMCNTNLPAGGEEWEPSHWDEITVGAGLTGLRRSVETLSDDISALNDAITIGTLLNGMPQTEMRIPANADLNSYTTPGTFFIYSDAEAGTIANTPRSASATVYVINRANANYKTQIYIPTSSGYVYFVRNYNAGSWTNWETILNPNNNIAKVEYGDSATKHYFPGDWLVLGNGSLYKTLAEIQNGELFTSGTNITATPLTVSDMLAQLANSIEFGEWSPHIYDLNTYVRATPHSGVYFHIGKLWVLAYETYDGGVACDLSGITTMLQIRNFPINGINVIGGVFDIDQEATVNNHYIQAAIENRIYFRPNVLSTAFTDATNVKMSFIVFGIKP